MSDSDIDLKKMNRADRYYHLHRDEKLAKIRERYHNNPDVIAKREERERKKAEKEAQLAAEKELKRLYKEQKRLEALSLATATSQRIRSPIDSVRCEIKI